MFKFSYTVFSIFLFSMVFFLSHNFGIIIPSFSLERNYDNNLTIFSFSQKGNWLSGGQFLIEPNPFEINQNFLKLSDNSPLDKNKKNGVILLTGLPYGTFTITQYDIQPEYQINNISKTFVFNGESKNYSFTFINKNKIESSISNFYEDEKKSYTYNAKFVCGSISGNEGPLRPGHYDTDISIYNKQKYPVGIFWNVIENEGSVSNAIIKTLGPESSTAIVCKDILNLLNKNQKNLNFIEGFVIIEENDIGSMSNTPERKSELFISQTETGLLDVQVFYTANALEQLPHEVLVGSIIFQITNNPSGKIPKDQLNIDLMFTSRINPNTFLDINKHIKSFLALHYNLTSNETELLTLKIRDSDVGVGSMIDDHAISLTHILPQYYK